MTHDSDGKIACESPFACRRAGILLHPTSLPAESGGGGLGQSAYNFVDFLAASGMSVWQTLPLGPTHSDLSPYQCLSVFAGSPSLINWQQLVEQGWLSAAPRPGQAGPNRESSFDDLAKAHSGFRKHGSNEDHKAFEAFKDEQSYWLNDYALYQALRHEFGRTSWLEWPAGLRDRDGRSLKPARTRSAETSELICFEQFIFHRQWYALKRYANDRGVLLFGDLPIFVAHDSAEVWARREYFTLDAHGNAETVAGVPPDYFSATGQRWGNPHYRWARMQEDNFDWWCHRIKHQLELFDLVRIDHFRGFEAYWEIPAHAETAMEGHWVKAPGDALFRTLQQEFDPLPLVAEDLGLITPEVDELRHRYKLPGMKVLQFAFEGGADNPYLPHNHERDYVVYTGTHDNNTTLGWFESQNPELQRHVLEYLGAPGEGMPWPLVRSALASVAQLAVMPLQDVLSLGEEHRMNRPGTTEGNWQWRFVWDQVPHDSAQHLRRLVELYGRLVTN
jgi:4-alpha-glucanotransferase